MDELARIFIESISRQFTTLKWAADKALEQIDENVYFHVPREHSNSVAIIVKHLGGNLVSRFTDFLTTDGEKPDRNRDGEFHIAAGDTRERVTSLWERGWSTLFAALDSLQPGDLRGTITIRGEVHTVVEALHRSLGHCGWHVGQILYLCKLQSTGDWTWITIAPGGSAAFNEAMRSQGS